MNVAGFGFAVTEDDLNVENGIPGRVIREADNIKLLIVVYEQCDRETSRESAEQSIACFSTGLGYGV